jgi:hypothetical protein
VTTQRPLVVYAVVAIKRKHVQNTLVEYKKTMDIPHKQPKGNGKKS